MKAEDLEEVLKGRNPRKGSPAPLDLLRAKVEFERHLRWEHARDHGLLDVLMPPEARHGWWNLPLAYLALIYAGLTAVGFALPWAIYLPCRWIIRGFLN